MRYQCFLALVALLLPLIAARLSSHGERITTTANPIVEAIGKFAVFEYNKHTTKKLVFRRVVSYKPVPKEIAIIYDLVIVAKNESWPSHSSNYRSSVLVGSGGILILKTFGDVHY